MYGCFFFPYSAKVNVDYAMPFLTPESPGVTSLFWTVSPCPVKSLDAKAPRGESKVSLGE